MWHSNSLTWREAHQESAQAVPPLVQLRKAQKMSLHMLVAVGFSYSTPLYNARHQHHTVSFYLGERKFSTILSLFPHCLHAVRQEEQTLVYAGSALFSVSLFMLIGSCNMFIYICISPRN